MPECAHTSNRFNKVQQIVSQRFERKETIEMKLIVIVGLQVGTTKLCTGRCVSIGMETNLTHKFTRIAYQRFRVESAHGERLADEQQRNGCRVVQTERRRSRSVVDEPRRIAAALACQTHMSST